MTWRAPRLIAVAILIAAFSAPISAQQETVTEVRAKAEQGDAEAQFNLGVMYANGEGVPQDDVTAYMWYNLAASRSTGEVRDRAVQTRDLAETRLTASQRAEAQRLAREWDAAHPR